MYQILIVLGCLILFFTTFILNKRTKVDIDENEVEIPEQCLNCHNKTCLEQKKQNINVNKCNEGENSDE